MEEIFSHINIEQIFSYICKHADQAHWLIFCLLLLTGLNIPISEDILIIGAGAIASSCIPDHAWRLYTWSFLGSYLSAWIAYWIGRLFGRHLYTIPMLSSVITPQRLAFLRSYYSRFGVFTFIVGRFFPGGIRNALFFSSGMTKMAFHLFILRDGFACLISSAVFFQLGYRFAQHLNLILFYFHRYTEWFLFLILAVGISIGIYFWKTRYGRQTK
jgi:membrane-associated protein